MFVGFGHGNMPIIGHAQPGSWLGNVGNFSPQDKQAYAELLAVSPAERWCRAQAGLPTLGATAPTPKRRSADDEAFLASHRAKLAKHKEWTKARQQKEDDELRRRAIRVLAGVRATTTAPPAQPIKPKVAAVDLYETCVHEAGHSWMAAFDETKVFEASVVPEGTTRGHVTHGPATARKDLRIAAAGPIAHCWWLGESWKPLVTLKGRDASDWLAIREHGPDDVYVEQLIWEVSALVKHNWSTILKIADRLLEKKEIDGDEVRAIVDHDLAQRWRRGQQ